MYKRLALENIRNRRGTLSKRYFSAKFWAYFTLCLLLWPGISACSVVSI